MDQVQGLPAHSVPLPGTVAGTAFPTAPIHGAHLTSAQNSLREWIYAPFPLRSRAAYIPSLMRKILPKQTTERNGLETLGFTGC